jgi:hypothetical protein
MEKAKSQPTSKQGAFAQFVTTLIFSLALGVPIVVGVVVAVKGYFRAWDRGDWVSILVLVVCVLALCVLEMPGWLAMQRAKKQQKKALDHRE